MAAQRSMDEFLISSEESEEQEEQTQMSQNATQSLYDADDRQLFELGDSVSNKRWSIEHESDLSEGHESESEDDNNRNTVSAGELPMSQSQESEPIRRRLKKSKKRSIKHRKVAPESEGPHGSSSDAEVVEIEESQQSTRSSKFITIKTEKAELKKQAQELENIIMKNKAKGKPPAK